MVATGLWADPPGWQEKLEEVCATWCPVAPSMPLLASLTKRPGEYMREFYYTWQPVEFMGNAEALRPTFEMTDAENQLMYSSDYPHWDSDLPFLSEETKRTISGGNALELFDTDDVKTVVSKTESRSRTLGRRKRWLAN